MNRRHPRRFLLACLAGATLLALAAGPANAVTTLVNATFDAGALPSRLNDLDDPADADWWAVGPHMSPADSVVSLTTDPLGFDSGNCLRGDKSLGSYPLETLNSRVWVNFPGYDPANETADNVVLAAAGDYLQMTFKLHITNIVGDNGGGFRFGFYSKDSLYTTTADPLADKTNSSGYLSEANGYFIVMGVGDGDAQTGTSLPHKVSVTRETDNGATPITSAETADQDNSYSYITTYELDAQVHTIRLRLTRTDTGPQSAGMKTTLWVDNMTTPLLEAVDDGTLSTENATEPYNFLSSFDALLIGNRPGGSTSDGAGSFLVDNAVVEAEVTLPVFVPGDTNGNGIVDATDAAKVAENWGADVGEGGYSSGDFNGDHRVNALDAAIQVANWGSHVGESTAVPEPSWFVLLVGALLAAARRRRGREN